MPKAPETCPPIWGPVLSLLSSISISCLPLRLLGTPWASCPPEQSCLHPQTSPFLSGLPTQPAPYHSVLLLPLNYDSGGPFLLPQQFALLFPRLQHFKMNAGHYPTSHHVLRQMTSSLHFCPPLAKPPLERHGWGSRFLSTVGLLLELNALLSPRSSLPAPFFSLTQDSYPFLRFPLEGAAFPTFHPLSS